MDGFAVAGGSVPGTDHISPGKPGWKNNQDAYAFRECEDQIVAVVCDGCGSASDAEVGAKLGAAFIAKRLTELAHCLSPEAALKQLENDLIAFIESIARAVGDDLDETVRDRFFLFTIVGALVTQERTIIFEAGDGYYALNGAFKAIDGLPNAPPYLGHRLANPAEYRFRNLLHIRIRENVPTADVESVFLGTDGVRFILEHETAFLPGANTQMLGPVSQFWTEPRFVKNEDNIRRRLALANIETVDGKRVKPGILWDDTAIVVIRRLQVNSEPVLVLEPVKITITSEGAPHA